MQCTFFFCEERTKKKGHEVLLILYNKTFAVSLENKYFKAPK